MSGESQFANWLLGIRNILPANPNPGCGSRTPLISPVPNLLTSDIEPSATENELIHNFLAQSQAQMADVDSQIHQVTDLVERLIQERSKLSSLAENHRALVAPIRKLPPEILAEIFIESLPEDREGSYPWHPPLLVAQISRSWRRIALSTPKLWANIHIDLRRSNFPRVMSLVQAFTPRFSNHPLTLSVIHEDDRYFDSSPLLMLLLEHSDKWTSARFCLPIPMLKILAPARGRLSTLDTLNLSTPLIYAEDLASDYNVFETAPRLREVTVSGNLLSTIVALPWPQLLSWSSHHASTSFADCFELLARAPNLRSLTIRLWDTDTFPIPLNMVPCTLPFLTRLELSLHEQSDLSFFLDDTDLPSLTFFSLNIANSPLHLPWPQATFIAFLKRSRFLRSLTIQKARFSHNELSNFLSYTPLLTELHLEFERMHTINDSLMRTLTLKHGHDSSEDLVPKLRTLGFTGDIQCSDIALIPMLLSRKRQDGFESRCLESILLDFNGPHNDRLDSNLSARLHCLGHQGLRVILTNVIICDPQSEFVGL